MNIVREIQSKLVLYMTPEEVVITDRGMMEPLRAFDIKPDTHEVVNEVDAPEFFVGGLLSYDGVWAVADQVRYDEAFAAVLLRYKQSKLDALAAFRYQKEIGGVLFNGMTVPTDRQSQSMLTGAYNAMQIDPTRIINWKTNMGYLQLDAATITMLSSVVANHIQSCFTREMELAAAIEIDVNTDITTGWPS